jgi:hypothetical protein
LTVDLPAITRPVVIAAQPSQGVVLEGNGANNGLVIWAATTTNPGTTIRGLTIRGFHLFGVVIAGPNGTGTGAGDSLVTGDTITANGSGGIEITGTSGNTVGGTTADAGNVITANGGPGILITGAGATGNVVQGNHIGTVDGTTAATNTFGVDIEAGASGNTIGSDALTTDLTAQRAAGNVIGLNAAGGVLIASGNGNVVRGNSIFQNNGHGIILGPGANNGATAPVLTAASYVGTSASVQGTITSTAFDRRIDFYANPVTNPGNPNPTPIPTPEGKTLIYSYTLTANDGTINPTFPTNLLAVNQFLTATITGQNGNTSALSNAIIVTNGLVVTTAADNGDNTNPILGSLRAAIINANMQAGKGQIINFVFDSYNPPVNGLWTINLASPLPDIVNPVTINGYSAAGALPNTQTTGDNAQLEVVIDSATGVSIPSAFHFVAGADGSAVSGLVIEGFTDAGIRLSGGGGYTITGNFIGAAAHHNQGQGVLVDGATSVTIGGANPSDRNIISGNGQDGVSIVVPTTVVTPSYTLENNFIGVDITGASALGNGGDGVVVTITGVATAPALSIFGNTHDGNGNVIGGNTGYGIRITGAAGSAPAGSGTLIAGNLIGVGLGSNGLVAVGNSLGGVLLDAAANVTVGGTGTGEGNAIGANQGDGVAVHNGNGIRITGNLLGGAAAGLGNAQDGIYVDPSSGVVITFNQMTGNAGDGVHLVAATGAKVGGNFIGVSTTGTGGPALSNGSDGVLVQDSHGVLVGNFTDTTPSGPVTVPGNVIGNNARNGVEATGTATTSLVVQDNFIGTDVNGTTALGNSLDGLLIDGHDASSNPTAVGDTVTGNVVSNNGGNGVEVRLASSVTIVSNKVGTDAKGSGRHGNGSDGIIVVGPAAALGISNNIVSANVDYGILATDVSTLTVSGNKVGTDAAGSANLGNGTVVTHSGSPDTFSGGGVRIEGLAAPVTNVVVQSNTISGNNGNGLEAVNTSGLVVTGNIIGLDATGTAALGNRGDGAFLDLSTGAVFGSPNPGSGNIVSGNGGYGLELIDSPSTTVLGNKFGTDINGAVDRGNSLGGLTVQGKLGPVAGDQVINNTISANTGAGLEASNVTGLVVQGNRVGLDGSGTFAVGTQTVGVSLIDAPGAQVVGNWVGGNKGTGLRLTHADNASVQGNFIGTGATGQEVLGNGGDGIQVVDSTGVTIGGSTGNTVVNNGTTGTAPGHSGIEVTGTSTITIAGNRIGVSDTASGYLVRGNVGDGVLVSGPVAAKITGNTVGGNQANGIEVTGGASATIQSNFIGTNEAVTTSPSFAVATLAMGNIGNGVLVTNLTVQAVTTTALVGKSGASGPDTGGNVIVNNRTNGVLVGYAPTTPGNVAGPTL